MCVLGIPTKVLRLDNKHLYPQNHLHTHKYMHTTHTHTTHIPTTHTAHIPTIHIARNTPHTLPPNYLNIVLFGKIASFFFSVETITVAMDPELLMMVEGTLLDLIIYCLFCMMFSRCYNLVKLYQDVHLRVCSLYSRYANQKEAHVQKPFRNTTK